jgi:hypothetical protein
LDGKVTILCLDEEDLVVRKNPNMSSVLTNLMSLSGRPQGKTKAAARSLLECRVGREEFHAPFEKTEPPPSGVLANEMRAMLTSIRLLSNHDGADVMAVGGFSGLVRVVDLSLYLSSDS